MDQVAKDYPLKWYSGSSYLHSCIAKSLQSESFADVALVTTDGRHIMAHRLVLSACSQYLHQVLKLQPKITTALPLMIILPPPIDYKTMKTLIQYMYSGEVTVPKDYLEPVFRGGDILKVKGLWLPKEDENQVKVSHKNHDSGKDKDKSKANNKAESAKEKESTKVPNYTIDVMKTNDATSELSDKNDSNKTPEPEAQHKSRNLLHVPQQISAVIKEEAIERSEVQDSELELIDEKKVLIKTEMTIKPEIYMEDSQQQALYSPLTCKLCTETFTLPAEWVRHVHTHTDMLPAKRQRRGRNHPDDDTDAPYSPLRCDLCQKYFATPSKWVHHIQNTHTESELHLSNKTTPGKVIKTPKSFGPAQNSCTICSKKFPSHASLLIHKRTHTGEKPFMCELCYKGFHVKSNLLRHLRTVHDKIMNPTDVEDASREDASGGD